MNWFKHRTNARRDPVLKAAVDKFGPRAYYAYFVILELMGENFDLKVPEKLHISCVHLEQELHSKRKTTQNVLNWFQERGKLKWQEKGGYYLILLPKFKDFTDKYTQDKLRRIHSPDCSETAHTSDKRLTPDKTYKTYTLSSPSNNTSPETRKKLPGRWTRIKDVLQTKLKRKKEEAD